MKDIPGEIAQKLAAVLMEIAENVRSDCPSGSTVTIAVTDTIDFDIQQGMLHIGVTIGNKKLEPIQDNPSVVVDRAISDMINQMRKNARDN